MSTQQAAETSLQKVQDSNIAEALQRAEIAQQVELAHKYPRIITKAIENAMDLATRDPDVAESCYYTLKRKDRDGKTKLITGPSIRLAEITSSSWGNLRAAGRCISVEETRVICQGICHDMQTGNVQMAEVWARIVDRNGKRYSEDMINTTVNATSSKAKRNAINAVVPRAAVTLPIMNKCMAIVAGDEKTLADNRETALKYVETAGVTRDRVYAALGIAGPEELGTNELAILRGMLTAIKEGEATVEEQFPVVDRTPKPKSAAPPAPPGPQTAEQPSDEKPASKPAEQPAQGSGPAPAEQPATPASQPPAEPPSQQSAPAAADPEVIISRRDRGRLIMAAANAGKAIELLPLLKQHFGVEDASKLPQEHLEAALALFGE